MTLNFEIVEPQLADVPALAVLHTRCWQHAYRGIFPDHILDELSVVKRIEGWGKTIADEEVFSRAAILSQKWLGFVHAGPARLSDGEGEVYGIYVDQSSYRQGVGRTLFSLALQDLKSRGFQSCVLGVLKDNQRARKFYDAMGGEVTDQPLSFQLEGVEYPEVMYRFAL